MLMIDEMSVDSQASTKNLVTDDSILALETEERGHDVGIARVTAVQSVSDEHVLANRNASGAALVG